MGARSFIPPRRTTLALVLLAAVALVATVGLSVALTLAPGLLLALLLAHGIRPGEQLIDRLRRSRDRGRRRPAVLVARPALPLVIARTGRLLHAALAMRPPPAPRLLAVT